MKYLGALLYAGLTLQAQSIPVPAGPNPSLSLPAVDDRALTTLVSSSVSRDGTIHPAADLYLMSTAGGAVRQLTNLTNNGTLWIDLSSDGSKAAYNVAAGAAPGTEEIHVLDTTSGADQKVAVDTTGCILPLASAICFGCFFTCVRTVHLSPDASKVVYSALERQPVYVVNADGSGVFHLPIAGATLAPSPQRVVSRNGLLVFSTANDVFVANLDGSGVQNLTNFPAAVSPLNATISEDGGTIAFQAGTQVYIVRLDGNPPMPLTSPTPASGNPSLSADGSHVAYLASLQAFLQPTDGIAPPVRLTNFSYSLVTGVTLSGDGSTALVSASSAIYVAGTGLAPRRLFAPRAILTNGITSFTGLSAPSPGSLMRITGWNFQDDAEVFAGSGPLPVALGGVSVNANGQAIPLASVTPSQITAQLLFTTPAAAVKFALDFADTSALTQELTATATVNAAAPEILQYVQPFFSSTYAAAFHAGSAIPADQGHPAAPGETLEMYGLGLGAVSPAVDAGVPAPSNPPARAIAAPQVKIGNQIASVAFAGLAPGQVGIYQVNAVVPSGLKSGSQSVSWSIAGQPSSVTWTIWVQ